jgi:rSAM/selenodomain-associated transferase 1
MICSVGIPNPLERVSMAYEKQLGIFVKVPLPGEVKTRLVPPLTENQACRLYTAFVRDLSDRIGRLKKLRRTVFCSGAEPSEISDIITTDYNITPQIGTTLGDRLSSAFHELLDGENRKAIIIGSDSPDLPVQYIKRAYIKLKHKDVVLGPSMDGGYYLIGLKSPEPRLFKDVDWSGRRVLEQTLQRVHELGLSLSMIPLWYGVDTFDELCLLHSLVHARKLESSGRLPATEPLLEEIFGS